MKIILAAVNARYVHTNLAIRSLAKTLNPHEHEILIKEFSVSQKTDEIVRDLYETQPDVIGFSCYIWNIHLIKEVVGRLKKVSPDTMILLGGPEVSYDASSIMKGTDSIDCILRGPAEETFKKLIHCIAADLDYSALPGIVFRAKGEVIVNPAADLNEDFPFPYDGEVLVSNRIYYYESTRGCPFTCQFCLSGNETAMMELPLSRVFNELGYLLDQKPKQIKFVDRTFNVNQERAMKILEFLILHDNGVTNFHFEINANLVTREMILVVQRAPKGLFQFEIGLQSTNPMTLEAIGRPTEQSMEFYWVQQLVQLKKPHIHVDIIAGLPHESYYSFRQSFNDVFSLMPDMLQLGFLKLFKGTGLRMNSDRYQYVYTDEPPYEILENHSIVYSELLMLKDVEEMLEKYWNSGKYRNSIHIFLKLHHVDAFHFMLHLSRAYHEKTGRIYKLSDFNEMMVLFDYMTNQLPDQIHSIKSIIHFDFCLMAGMLKPVPNLIKNETGSNQRKILHQIIHHQVFQKKWQADYNELPSKKTIPYLRIVSLPRHVESDCNGSLEIVNSASTEISSESNCEYLMIYRQNKDRDENRVVVIPLKEVFHENTVPDCR